MKIQDGYKNIKAICDDIEEQIKAEGGKHTPDQFAIFLQTYYQNEEKTQVDIVFHHNGELGLAANAFFHLMVENPQFAQTIINAGNMFFAHNREQTAKAQGGGQAIPMKVSTDKKDIN